jgi:hypothetical protein
VTKAEFLSRNDWRLTEIAIAVTKKYDGTEIALFVEDSGKWAFNVSASDGRI